VRASVEILGTNQVAMSVQRFLHLCICFYVRNLLLLSKVCFYMRKYVTCVDLFFYSSICFCIRKFVCFKNKIVFYICKFVDSCKEHCPLLMAASQQPITTDLFVVPGFLKPKAYKDELGTPS
jgi:hypothetical protein